MTIASALHVVFGESAAASLKEAYGLTSDRVLIQRDLVSYGPAPDTRDLSEWRSVRERFLRELHPRQPHFSFDESGDLIANFHRLADAPLVIAWLGEGTADQMFAAWLVHYLRATRFDLSRLHVITFERGSWRSILSAGELSAEQMRARASDHVSITLAQADELALVWQCYTSSNPRALAAYLDTHAGPLRDAVAPILLRYPEAKSGLGFWDRLLLENVRDHGPRLVAAIGSSMVPLSPENYPDMIGDGFLFDRALKMSPPRAVRPLIAIDGDRNDMRACTAALTSEGFDVLAGKQNAVALNGIDDWIGGVHLTPQTVVYRDGARLI